MALCCISYPLHGLPILHTWQSAFSNLCYGSYRELGARALELEDHQGLEEYEDVTKIYEDWQACLLLQIQVAC